jgi:hypothetical protein
MGKAKTIGLILVLLITLVGLIFLALGYFNPQGSAISVESSPEATVYIDGQAVGKTPYSVNVKPGEISLKLVPDGIDTPFFSYETKINLSPGVKTVIRRDFGKNDSDSSGEVISFEKIPEDLASLSIISVPDAAQISIDGVVKGFTPIKISRITPGEHELTVMSPGYKTKTFKINTIQNYKLTVISKLAEDTEVKASPAPVLGVETEIKQLTILETPTGYLNVRRDPSSASLEVGRVTPGLKYELVNTDEKSGWYQIKYDGEKLGWVSNKYAKIDGQSNGDSTVKNPNNDTNPQEN